MGRKRGRKAPTICIEEHFSPAIKSIFQEAGFRVLRFGETAYRGLDERDYLDAMYAQNEVFVTGDQEFITEVVKSGGTRHAGIVWIPSSLTQEEQETITSVAAGFVKVRVDDAGPLAMRGLLIEGTSDGLTAWDGTKQHLVIRFEG